MMETLQISFGAINLKSKGKITERIKTFEDACKEIGINPLGNFQIQSDVAQMSKHLKAVAAFSKLIIIAEALNEGWVPNWDKSSEYKWYPYFDMRSGFGFSFTRYVNWGTNTYAGSRLCFKSSELAEYAGKQFESIYKDFITL